ncbi:unnamed protein product [Lepeophtheirus salmonis]|uniref:(salmon louse) hypothetical protein n=1 Tax=Lepeophtheirus salmonis TaxID=72036 RepID=A0A7R8CQ68_LEPSM|nr:unnamed protein product [Lepeophtheirus salmonis]CAF2892551.1 unnamed protein product [Lepeophtheirus salmonis]
MSVNRKKLNLDEVLQYLDELSDDEDLDVKNQNITKVYIEPPINVNEWNSDVDSGDEEDPSIVSQSGNQLLSPASLVKIWAAAKTLGSAVQFYPYPGKDSSYNKDIGLGGSVIMNLVSKLPKVPDSNYHIVMDNFFTSPRLVRLLKENGIAARGTLRANRTKNAPLIAIDEMKKGSRGIFDAVNDNKYNVTLVRWKDNKVVTVASTLYGK